MSSTLETNGYLEEVEATLASVLVDTSPPGRVDGEMIMTAARHLCVSGGGKRIRPILVHHFGAAVGVPADARLVRIGVAAELIHSASLLHDDVVDAGMFRRGRPTVNSLWGNVVAVMSGDMVLTVALQQLTALDMQLTQDALACVHEMTRGTIAELEARGDLEMPIARMRVVADGKTGALFAFCGIAAAHMGKDEAAAAAFEEFGRRLGIAFQIADDIKDLVALDEGKPRFADLASKTPSLPVLIAAHKSPELKRRILDAWSFGELRDDRLRELGLAVIETGAVDEAIRMMKAEVRTALEVFRPYAETEGGRALVGYARQLEAAFDERHDRSDRERNGHEGHPVDGAEAPRQQRAV